MCCPNRGSDHFFAGLLQGVSGLDMCNPKKCMCSTEVDEVKKQVLEHVEAWALVLKTRTAVDTRALVLPLRGFVQFRQKTCSLGCSGVSGLRL